MGILDNVSFEADPGTIWLVYGDCGTGKTTLARVLSGAIPAIYRGFEVQGDVYVFGYRPSEALSRGITMYVPQDISLTSITTSASEELEALGLGNRVTELRGAVGELADRRFTSLSAGERYGVLSVMAALLGKKLILLDEPSSYLDPESLSDVLDVLRSYAEKSGSTIIVFDHDPQPYHGKVDGAMDLGRRTRCFPPADLVVKRRVPGDLLLDAHEVSRRFGGRSLFSNVCLRVYAGSVTAVVGPNSSGKTTLLKILLGLTRSSGGVIRRYYRRAFYLPQLSSYWILTDTYGALRKLGCLPSVVAAAGISGLDTSSLSLGEVRRLSIYAGVYGESDLVVIDELSLGMDPASLKCVKDVLDDAREMGKAVVFATHSEYVARYVDPDNVVRLG
mgnify:CR=1 FL=1